MMPALGMSSDPHFLQNISFEIFIVLIKLVVEIVENFISVMVFGDG